MKKLAIAITSLLLMTGCSSTPTITNTNNIKEHILKDNVAYESFSSYNDSDSIIRLPNGEYIHGTKEECENCDKFDSRYIEYPLTIKGIENDKIDISGFRHEIGCLCEIKPCGEEYKNKSYIGFYLGDLPIAIHTSFSRDTGILKNSTMNNPAIFVPELKKIIYGCESWWREIESVDDFTSISEEDIENTWYVKLLKSLN